MENNKDVLLLYSGGGDSKLSAYRLVEDGYNVHLVHFTKVSTVGTSNVEIGIKELIDNYGYDGKIDYVGTFDITSDFFKLLTTPEYFNATPKEIMDRFGNVTYNQIQCLSCRSVMYMYAIGLAKMLGYKYIAEGARKSQMFAIEQPEIIQEYGQLISEKKLCALLNPVYYLDDDRKRFFELARRGDNGSREDKCLFGYPMNEPLTKEELQLYVNYYREIIRPYIDDTLESHDFNKSLERKLSLKRLVK